MTAAPAIVPLVEAITTDAMRERVIALRAQRPDVDVLAQMLTPAQLLEWTHGIAPTIDDAMRSLIAPIPPHSYRSLVGGRTEALFLWTGLRDANNLYEAWAQHAEKVANVRVLDFGGGCGRTARFLAQAPHLEVTVADVNPDHVAWCKYHVPNASALQSKPLPPLSLPDDSFDVVFALSVFSHLPLSAMHAWLEELSRVTAKNGLLLLTTHGTRATTITSRSAPHQKILGMTEAEAKDLYERLPVEGYVYRPSSSATKKIAKVGDEYGNIFLSEAFIHREWPGKNLKIVNIITGGLRNWQDIVILRRI